MRVLIIVATICVALFGPLCTLASASPKSVSSKQGEAIHKTVDELRTLMDGTGRRLCIDSMDALCQAGFSYQKQLIVPEDIDLQCKSADAKNVIAGMQSTDWDYALYFRQPVNERGGLRAHMQGGITIAPSPLSQAEWEKIRQNPSSPDSCDILVRHSLKFKHKMLDAARKNPSLLDALGGRLYGEALESLYITAVLLLAAEETETINGIHDLHATNFEHQLKVLQVLVRSQHLGNTSHIEERMTLSKHLVKLLRTHQGKPNVHNLATIIELIQPVRDAFLAPCPR